MTEYNVKDFFMRNFYCCKQAIYSERRPIKHELDGPLWVRLGELENLPEFVEG
jgi:hypothetical protein